MKIKMECTKRDDGTFDRQTKNYTLNRIIKNRRIFLKSNYKNQLRNV